MIKLILCIAVLVSGVSDLCAQELRLSSSSADIFYNSQTGEGSAQFAISIEQIPPSPIVNIQGLSFSLALDTSLVRVASMDLAPYLGTINGPPLWEPAFSSFEETPEGISYGCVIHLFGVPTLQFETQKDICLITLETKEHLFVGSTNSETVDLDFTPDFEVPSGGVVHDVYVVGGNSFTFEQFHNGLIQIAEQSTVEFVRADCNADGSIDIADAIFVESYLFLGAGTPDCLNACDSNTDGRVDIADAVYTLSYLFSQGQSPALPFPNCGLGVPENSIACPIGSCP